MRRLVPLALVLALAACSKETPQPAGSTAPPSTPSAARKTAGIDVDGIDKNARPGDDFDRYANGAWRDRTEIPPDRASTGIFLKVFELSEQRNAELIAGAAKANAAPGSDQRRIADFYSAFLDTDGIERRGLAPIKPALDAIAAIADRTALSKALGADLRADVDPLNATNFQTEHLFGLFVTQSLDDPSRTVPYLLQGGLGLPDREYYLSQQKDMAALRSAYTAYLGKVFTLTGLSDPAARAARVMALETKIARAHVDLVTSQDVHKANNPWARSDFPKKAPGIDWDAYFAAASLANQQDFLVWMPTAVTGLSRLAATEPLDAWRDWLAFHHVNAVRSVLPKAFDEAGFEMYGRTLSGTKQPRPRDKRAIAAVNGFLGDAVGRIYADRFFPASSKADIQDMVKNILAAFDARVAALDWMSPATKAEARKKIATIQVGIGYPESWRDYSGLDIKPDDPAGNMERAELAEYRHQISKIGKAPDPKEWWMTPQTVNAVNLPLQNALNFPAAILETPFYDARFDPAANYGSIGAVIGHEISHSFDNMGAEFDASGKLRKWWTPADYAHFKEAGAALVAQYNAYEPLPGLHINGQQTLGENIADVAGLTAAYEAYHASLGGKPAPVVDGLTGDQRFFLAYAQSWREKTREETTRALVATDGHSPGQFRAETVRNLDAWYAAFNVQPGEKLYLDQKQRVRVW